MKIAVMGANGTLGRAVVDRAVERGHDLVAITRGAPKRAFFRAVQRSADVLTGEGVANAIAGADVLVNAVNTQKGVRTLLLDGTRRLLGDVESAGVRHYVAISMVGIDAVPLAYHTVKLEEERIVEKAKVGWSLLRATHFHDFVDTMFSSTARFGILLAAPGARLQPIDVRDVADAIIDCAEAGPKGRVPEVGGPQILLMRELAKQWLAATRRKRFVMPAPTPGELGRQLRAGAFCTPDRAVGRKTFAQWLDQRYGA